MAQVINEANLASIDVNENTPVDARERPEMTSSLQTSFRKEDRINKQNTGPR